MPRLRRSGMFLRNISAPALTGGAMQLSPFGPWSLDIWGVVETRHAASESGRDMLRPGSEGAVVYVYENVYVFEGVTSQMRKSWQARRAVIK